MPVEPLSLTASVIGVTILAYNSCKKLKDTIQGLKQGTPDTLQNLQNAAGSFEAVLRPLEHDLGGPARMQSSRRNNGQASLRARTRVRDPTKPTACDEFTSRLAELTSHSDEQRVAPRDRTRLHFHHSDVRVLKET